MATVDQVTTQIPNTAVDDSQPQDAPAPAFIYGGGSDLNPIQQAEPSDTMPNTGTSIVLASDPSSSDDSDNGAWQMTVQPVTQDLSDPYFGYSSTDTLSSDPAASGAPWDTQTANSTAEANRLQGFAPGTLGPPQAGSSIDPTSEITANPIADLYVNIGIQTLGAGQQPGASIALGSAAVTEQQEVPPTDTADPGLSTGLQLKAGPNNRPGTAHNPLVVAAVLLFVVITVVKLSNKGHL